MKEKDNIIRTICEGGSGSEALILVQLRNIFPGIGGTIKTKQVIETALREEYSPFPGIAHKNYIKHAIIKKIDDYFHRMGKYIFSHITRPLGSISGEKEEKRYEAYMYSYETGVSSFPWEYTNNEGNTEPVILEEFGLFCDLFYEAGIELGTTKDITDPDNGKISQNIIHRLHSHYPTNGDLNCLWKRIDFGQRSMNIKYDLLEKFLQDKSESLKEVIGMERYLMIVLANKFLFGEISGKKINEKEKGQLEILIGNYRKATMRDKISEILSSVETNHFVNITEGNEFIR
jgi:hypothetical protein